MKKFIVSLLALSASAVLWAQNPSAMDQLKDDPKKSYGTDYPYLFKLEDEHSKAPKGYKPFYISHYARHGSRYYWNERLYVQLDTLLTKASQNGNLTAEGDAFFARFMQAKNELMTGVSELTQLGWEQHQAVSRRMYRNFPEVFENGGDVLAISSLSGRCVLSMAAFCQELVQCNPKIEIREQSSRFTLDGVVPTDGENPARRSYPAASPRYEKNMDKFKSEGVQDGVFISRVFKNPEGLPEGIEQSLINLYTSLPNIGHEGMMGDIITDQEIVERWEMANLGSYSWVFSGQYEMIPILEDIISKADSAIDGTSVRIADLRFGHDSCIGPLTVLMGINGADSDPEDPYQVKNIYQNWMTCKSCNLQLVFYRGKKASDEILVKCLMNESEASLPVETDIFPYYKWSDVKAFYLDRCNSVSVE